MSAAEAQEVKNLLLQSNDHYRQLAERHHLGRPPPRTHRTSLTSPPQNKSKKSPLRNGNWH